jgi:hypothetical protein
MVRFSLLPSNQSCCFIFFLLLALTLAVGCDDVAQGVKKGWMEAEVEGKWKYSSMEGVTPAEAQAAAVGFKDSELTLSSDGTFKLSLPAGVARGRWKREEAEILFFEEERNAKPITRDTPERMQFIGKELILKFEGKAIVFEKAN